jgi:pyridoxal 4-dehydrogenase
VIADVLVGRGWEVWAADVADGPDDAPPARRHVKLDVTDAGSVDRLMSDLREAGGLQALINNAGIFPLAAWDELEISSWQRTLDVNLTGTFRCAIAAACVMRETRTEGSIVNIASASFFKGLAAGLAYTASKGGVVGFTRSLALALAPDHIRVNAVAPGMMLTEGVREHLGSGGLVAQRWKLAQARSASSGPLETDDVANLVAFLVGAESRALTGQVLVADGGAAPS